MFPFSPAHPLGGGVFSRLHCFNPDYLNLKSLFNKWSLSYCLLEQFRRNCEKMKPGIEDFNDNSHGILLVKYASIKINSKIYS